MIAKPLVLGLIAAASVTAAAGGAYLAVRQNHEDRPAAVQQAPAPQAPQPVEETEAVVSPPPAAAVEPEVEPAPVKRQPETRDTAPPTARRNVRSQPTQRENAPRSAPAVASKPVASESTAPPRPADPVPADPTTIGRDASVAAAPAQPEVPPAEPPAPPRPEFVDVVVPESSVVGLRVVTSVSSETARVEDRVEARVTRDVIADGQLAIPAGARVLGDVVTAERGGKMKEKARLSVRFHTLVLADGRQVPFRSDAINREGASPGAESARKIGGAAIGGAVLGAIIGGAKGAAIGGATGAAGGSAVVMAGDRNPATLPAGTIVTVRLTSPVTINVERGQD